MCDAFAILFSAANSGNPAVLAPLPPIKDECFLQGSQGDRIWVASSSNSTYTAHEIFISPAAPHSHAQYVVLFIRQVVHLVLQHESWRYGYVSIKIPNIS